MKHTFDFTTANKYKNLAPHINQVRFALIDYEIAHHGCIPLAKGIEIAEKAGVREGAKILEEMVSKNYISLNEMTEISCLYPVSCEETGHKVKLADGREFYAMCAVDAMGCAATFGMDVELSSYCKDTGEQVKAKITPQGITSISPDELYVSYYDSWAEGCYNY